MKAICIPCSGPVEVGGILPLLDHPVFQRLRSCRQLGLNDLVFPGARHSRLEHALGVLKRTREAARRQGFAGGELRNLELFALLHDVGHGPFSHQVEPVLAGDHHLRGEKAILALEGPIRQCGGDPEAILQMLRGKDPLGEWVSDRNLGADKLDYLERDALHIGFAGTPALETIQENTVRTADGYLALREKFIEEGKRVQKFYSYLHQHGYLNKTALSAQRMLQWALQRELALRTPGEADEIWEMTDDTLLEWLRRGRSGAARKMLRRLVTRDLLRTCLCLKPQGYGYVENVEGKDIALQEWPRQALMALSRNLESLDTVLETEDALAEAVHARPGEVLLAAMPYFRKLLPKDLRIANGANDYWLLEKDRDHKNSLESDYLRTFAVRVITTQRLREKLAKDPAPLLQVLSRLATS